MVCSVSPNSCALGHQQLFQTFSHLPTQHRFAIFGTEDEVIFQRENCASIMCIALMFHALSISKMLDRINISNIGCLPLGRGMRNWPLANLQFPCQLKQAAPLKASL